MMLTPLEATQTSATHYDTKLIEDFISELLFRTILVHIAGTIMQLIRRYALMTLFTLSAGRLQQ